MRPTVFVIEDDSDIAFLLRVLLDQAGVEMILSGDGRSARDQIDSMSPPELVLLDIHIPYINGIELLRHIRSKSEWRETPVYILSASVNSDEMDEAREAGATNFISKPFKADELLRQIRAITKTDAH